MGERNWHCITSGATFEALVTTLIFFEDAQAALFGRRGKDGGQDARSGDGSCVFQAKYHEDASAAKAIADAKTEAAKIATYRQPGHDRSAQWQGVTHWRLVTNAAFNPTDRDRWDKEVMPVFAAQGLRADYWERVNLDALLVEHPEVDRAFFQNETRAFLALPEVRERLPRDEPFLQRSARAACSGRENEIARIRDFLLSDKLFLVVHGAGGIGKTRLLVEAGEEIAGEGTWQVLWTNVESMTATATWFQAIVPERPTLLLLDEPEDAQLLQILAEQLGGPVGRTAKWKVAIAVRSPKDPVLRFLFAPRIKQRVQELPLAALPAAAAEDMCRDLLSSGALAQNAEAWRQNTAGELARRFSRHPVWLTLAVHVLETYRDLNQVPQTAEDLADSYLEEIIRRQEQAPSDQVLALLRWVALMGTVNRKDDQTINLIKDESGISDANTVRTILKRLVERKAFVQRGAWNRFVEVKPDVLRDHLLLNWLTVDAGYGKVPVQPSEDAKALVASVLHAVLEGNISAVDRSVLTSLARTELILKLSDRPVPLLDSFFTGILDALPHIAVAPRLVLTEVLLDVAEFRPVDTVTLSRALRSSSVSSETIPGLLRQREVGQDDVTLQLAWPVFHAAMGAQTVNERTQVLEELCALTEAEAEIASRRPGRLPNDGKRAADLVGRTLGGGPQFWGDFEEPVRAIAERLLARAARAPVAPSLVSALTAFLRPAMALTRKQRWYESYTFYTQHKVVLPGHPAWDTRELILRRIRALLADANVPLVSRLALWPVLVEDHRHTSLLHKQVPDEFQSQIRQYLLDDLVWARHILAARQVELEELKAVRALWDRDLRFKQDSELKAISEQLEEVYKQNALAAEFEPLFSRNSGETWEQWDQRVVAKAAELAAAQAPEMIGAFIDRAVRFFGGARELYRLQRVAQHLGQRAGASEVVRSFIRTSLAALTASTYTDFAVVAAASWVATLRNGATPAVAHDLVVELLQLCGSDAMRIQVAQKLYGESLPPQDFDKVLPVEHDHLRALAPLFVNNGEVPAFIQVIAWTLHYDWPALKTLLDTVLDGVPHQQVHLAIKSLVEAVYRAVCEYDATTLPSKREFAPWLLDQLLRLLDLDRFGDDSGWEVEEILERTGRAPLAWLPQALRQRRDMEVQGGVEKVNALGRPVRLCHYVTPIDATHIGDPEVGKAVEALVDLVWERGTVGYYIPEILQGVDPEGLLIPSAVARRLEHVTNEEDMMLLARIAGVYDVGGTAWRMIAKPVIVYAVRSNRKEERYMLFQALSDPKPRSWHTAPGEVAQIFILAVESARQMLESETDRALRPFWEWYLAVAESELKEQEEHAREVRGE